jgi:hypothetical protein
MALGDWDPGDPFKMHEPQEPDRYGWDICLFHQVIADDWLCTEDGYVKDIHFWTSWYRDNPGQVEEWLILIAEDMGGMPGPPIWQWDGLGNMKTRWYGSGEQGWHCPSYWEDTVYPDHAEYFQVNITNIENAFFQESGKLYWLMIMAWAPTWPEQVVGWKTSYTVNFSPALWTGDPLMGPWQPVETWDGWTDMAFVITSEEPKPQAEHLKWSQPPIEIDPTWEMPVYCGWDEPSYLLSLTGGGCVVVPNACTNVEGDAWNAWPFTLSYWPASSMRYQQIYDEDEVGLSGVVTEVRFRPDQGTLAWGPNSMDVEIYLGYSANPVAAPSEWFANNIGAGYVKVYDGTLTLSSSATGGPPHNFDVVVDVDDVFMYNPANGPLLLDIKMLTQSDCGYMDADGHSSGQTGTTRIFSRAGGSVNDPCGIVNYLGPTDPPYGLVTMFCFNGATPSMSAASRANAVAAPASEPSEFERLAGGGPDAVVSVSLGQGESSGVPGNSISSSQAAVRSFVAPAALANVAIFQDANPWANTWNQDILTANGISWTIHDSCDMGVVDLSPYDKVIVASQQTDSFYSALETNRAWFEAYASAGGLLDLHLAAYYATQVEGKTYPGGFVSSDQETNESDDVTIVNSFHPVVNGPHPITDADLDGWYMSMHGWFLSPPAGAVEVIEDANSGNPCTMELAFGSGRIFATLQTVEWHSASYNYLENTILYDLLVQVRGKIVADDFRCIGPMPVMSVHWWGSYFGWEAPEPPPEQPSAWRIGFWSNVPAGAADPEIYYSYPDKLLWQIEVPAERVKLEWVGYDQFPQMPSDSCFQYYVDLEPKEVFWQDDFIRKTKDNVFWLSVAAVYPGDSDIVFPWGWKTRPWSWMDDAVWFDVYQGLYTGMRTDPWDIVPIEDPRTGESFDVAFELDTDPNWIKWEQPFTGIRDWPHYEDELSMGIVHRDTEVKWYQMPDLAPEVSIDVDATTEGQWPPQILADDFPCQATGPITDIHIWGSWYHDYYGKSPRDVIFTLSIHEDIPADVSPTGHSMPGKVRWIREFHPGQFDAWLYADRLTEGWYVPCVLPPYYDYFADTQCWQYDFYIDREEAFHQQEGTIYWLDVQARPLDPEARFGWKASVDHWNDDGVFAVGHEPYEDVWGELRYPDRHPYVGESIDLAFAITTEMEELEIVRLAADDWPCEANTPVTAATWWGSYIGYQYEACQPELSAPPVKPDYFLLRVWDDVPAGVDLPYSHPNNVIWQYKAYDYDEVLVGYDKHPHAYIPNGANSAVQQSNADEQPKTEKATAISVEVGTEANVENGTVPAVYAGGPAPSTVSAAAAVVEDFPSADSTVVGSEGFIDGTQVGWFWSVGRGDSVTETFVTSEPSVDRAVFDFVVPTNYLHPGAYVNWDVLINGITTGSFTVNEGQTGAVHLDFAFAPIAGPGYTVRFEVTNEVPGGDGSHSLGYAGIHAGTVELFAPGREPVFRYSVRLPREAWFWQEDANNIYWFSVTAVYDGSSPNHDWGWTNHAYVAKDDAVAGYVDVSGPAPVWTWEELFDQTGVSEDLSFILFTWPWPPCWGYLTQCHGDADGDGSVKGSDFLALKASWYKCYPDPLYNPCADFDRNGCVKGSDFLILKKYWYQNPPADCPRGAKWPP